MNYETTLFVPTHNRPRQLNRLIRFLESAPDGIRILIADSSDSEILVQNARNIEESSCSNHVEHLAYEGVSLSTKYLKALGRVKTETVCFCGDDDLVLPEQLLRASHFLKSNKDFSHARGRMFTYIETSAMGLKRSLRIYPQWEIAMESPLARISYHLNHYISNFYSMRRLDKVGPNFERVLAMDIGSGLQERLIPVLDLLDGKGALFRDFFMFRQKGQTFVDESGNLTFWDRGLKGSAYAAELTRNADVYLNFIKDEVRSRVQNCDDLALKKLMSEFDRDLAVFFLDKERPKRMSARRVRAAFGTLSLKARNAAAVFFKDHDAKVIDQVICHIENHRAAAGASGSPGRRSEVHATGQ
jgi:glycosyltransferase domain-containing protein